MLKYLWLSAFVLLLDLSSKTIATQFLNLYDSIEIVHGWFNIILAHNPGAAFSFLADESGWQRWFLSIIAILVSTVILFWIKNLQTNERFMATALALILGGALGNLWNRLTLGYVIDIFDVYYQFDTQAKNIHWPAFNIADTAITIGAAMILIIIFFGKDQVKSNN